MIQLGFDLSPAAKALMSRQAEIMKLYQSVNVRFRCSSFTAGLLYKACYDSPVILYLFGSCALSTDPCDLAIVLTTRPL